jgi:hypothetical protein
MCIQFYYALNIVRASGKLYGFFFNELNTHITSIMNLHTNNIKLLSEIESFFIVSKTKLTAHFHWTNLFIPTLQKMSTFLFFLNSVRDRNKGLHVYLSDG